MSGANKGGRSERPSKSKHMSTMSGLEDLRVKVADKKGSDSKQSAGEEKGALKVEMQTLRLSKDMENQMLDTLRQLYGEGFTLKDRSEYKDKGSGIQRQYWMDQGGLVVLGGVDYSHRSRTKTFLHQNAFALSKLEKYGFHHNHCIEALQKTEGDMGAALELLLCCYFYKSPITSSDNADLEASTNYLEERSDEKASLESMYENAFEERISNRVWIIKLPLPYLEEKYQKPAAPSYPRDQSKGAQKELCRFFAKGQTCKFGARCRFSHQQLSVSKTDSIPRPSENFFLLEVRFPQGSKYPFEPPLVCLSTEAMEFPPIICLRITSRLVAEAKSCALQGIPSVFSLVELLTNQQDDILEHLHKIGEAFPDPNDPILETSEDFKDESNNEDEQLEQKQKTDVWIRQKRLTVSLLEQQRQNESIVKMFTERTKKESFQRYIRERKSLPVWEKGKEILQAIEEYQVVVISGETGCGKSTQIPQFLLDDWLLNFETSGKNPREIVCTQPRRISAIGVAERVAEERTEKIGDVVGYQIRLESKLSSRTRLLFCTTGILLRRLENDPDLQSVTHIVIDEVHERSEESDFLLLILRELLPKRPELRVILMSATLNAELFSAYFYGAPTITIPGRTFPVTQIFVDQIIEETNYVLEENSIYARKIKEKRGAGLDSMELELCVADIMTSSIPVPPPNVRDEMLTLGQLQARYHKHSMRTVKTLYLMDPEKLNIDLIETVLTWIVAGNHSYPQSGSILIFLPGIAEIRTLYNHLSEHPVLTPRSGKFVLVPLHSSLTAEEQSAVFRKPKGNARKIVLATNLAETSITIDDCVFVVDTGRMKEKRFDSNKNMESLDLTWVSRANAAQRSGRAGRVMPGICVHLYSQFRHDYNFLAQPVPELLRIPLEQLILKVMVLPNFRQRDIYEVFASLLEAPERESVESSIVRLQNVGAVDKEQNLSFLGHHLARLPVDVRIGKLMLFGAIFGCVDSALTIAACLSYKSPFVTPFNKREEADSKKKLFSVANSDHLTALEAYSKWLKANAISRRSGDTFAEENYLSWRTLITIADMKHQFLELLADIGFVTIEGRRRSGEDCVLQICGKVYNENGSNHRLLAAIVCAALYPNIVKVLTPAKTYAMSGVGAIPKDRNPDQISFKTKEDGYVNIHPSSINFCVGHYPSPYLVYQEKIKTSRIFVRECSMVSMLHLVLFTGKQVAVEIHAGSTLLSLEDGWILFMVETHQVAELLYIMRNELDKILQQKIKDPTLNLFLNLKTKKVISTIIALITSG